MDKDQINSIREALSFSPDNVPLRLILAKNLLAIGDIDLAEKEYFEVLNRDQGNVEAKKGVASIFYNKEDYGTATVIYEEIFKKTGLAEDQLLLAKSLFKEGNISDAQENYRDVIDRDSAMIDEELDEAFRMVSTSSNEDEDQDEGIDEDALSFLEKPNVNFDQVGGMSNVKDEINMKIIHPLAHPELYQAYGKKIGGGILLYGPPGCGKTHIARATAGQVDAKFINVGLSDVLDMWLGSSEKNLDSIFKLARKNKPCVIFIDEVDALGANKADMRHSAGRHVINKFLSELDGIDSDNEGVLIIGATNTPWHMDPAFKRPGRFDRLIFVPPPDIEGRKAILKIILAEKPVSNIDYDTLAKKTSEYSGADLKAILDIAIEEKLKESFKSGIPKPLTTKDLLKGVKKHKATTKEWFNTAKNYALYANDSGLYDDILSYLKVKK